MRSFYGMFKQKKIAKISGNGKNGKHTVPVMMTNNEGASITMLIAICVHRKKILTVFFRGWLRAAVLNSNSNKLMIAVNILIFFEIVRLQHHYNALLLILSRIKQHHYNALLLHHCINALLLV
jgi:hypothetical protein